VTGLGLKLMMLAALFGDGTKAVGMKEEALTLMKGLF